MKRRAVELTPTHGTKRKLRNRYQSESQRLQKEHGTGQDQDLSGSESAEYHTHIETNTHSGQSLDRKTTRNCNKDPQASLDDKASSYDTNIKTLEVEIVSTNIDDEETYTSENEQTASLDLCKPSMKGLDLSIQEKTMLRNSPTLTRVGVAKKSQDILIPESESKSLMENSHALSDEIKKEPIRHFNDVKTDGFSRFAENDGNTSAELTMNAYTSDACEINPSHEVVITDEDTNDVDGNDMSKDDGSRCSMDGSSDKNYRVNVGLYGTDLDEDLTHDGDDSVPIPSKRCLDKNNNQTASTLQLGGVIRPNIDHFVPDKPPMDEGSNTVDGFTRRALESQCNITSTDSQPCSIEQAPVVEKMPVTEDAVMADTSDNAVTLMQKAYSDDSITASTSKESFMGTTYPTDFAGVFKEGLPAHIPADHGNSFNSVKVPQSYGGYNAPGDGQYCKGSTPTMLSPSYPTRQGMLNSPLNIDENIVAEQLASELVQTYSGQNSHMISDILRNREERNFCTANASNGGPRQFEDLPGTQNVIHDVDLLNTPQQLPLVEPDFTSNQCYTQQGAGRMTDNTHGPNNLPPHAPSRGTDRHTPVEMHGRMTYNDIQVYGGKWSAINRRETVTNPSFHQDMSESPYPNQQENPALRHTCSPNPRRNDAALAQQSYMSTYPSQARSNHRSHTPETFQQSFNDYRQFNINTHLNKSCNHPSAPLLLGNHGQIDRAYPESPDPLGLVGMVPGSHGRGEEVTKMTYTPRGVMQTHLTQHNQYQKTKSLPKQQISDVDYSSIYPTREYIDQYSGTGSSMVTPKRDPTQTQTSAPKYTCKQDQPRQRKYNKPPKYGSAPLRAPPMPIFDEMMSKYPPAFSRETEPLNTRHKYVVVNPSNATEMPPKTLLLKYIDFLILENERITDISQSVGAPEDIYVTEDMYFMDKIKYMVPFPSQKFTDWVGSFFPRLDLNKMKFNGRYPGTVARDTRMVDPRPTQQVLEDTFYFFQRAVLEG